MRLSEDKLNRIKEELISTLFRNSPKAMFTSDLASQIIRDEEFVKKLLGELETKGLVSSVKKNNKGKDYSRRIRWRLTNAAFQAFQNINKGSDYNSKEHTFA